MSGLSFARRTPGKHKQEPYYWRGGDVLREREYLADEFKKALSEFRRADVELRRVEQELQQASDCLHEREEYTNALANFLDSDAEGGQIEADYKKRLAFLEEDIRAAEADLQEARAVHHPAVASGLQKEKAYLVIENQRNSKAIDLLEEQTTTARQQLAVCTLSNRYRQVLAYQTKLEDLIRKKGFLRQLVNRTKKEFDATRPIAAAQTPEVRIERAELLRQLELEESLNRGQEKQKRRPRKWRARLTRAIEAIDELNARLIDFGLVEAVVDSAELRERYLPPDSGDDGGEPANE
jgi:hypothetical protein